MLDNSSEPYFMQNLQVTPNEIQISTRHHTSWFPFPRKKSKKPLDNKTKLNLFDVKQVNNCCCQTSS